MKIYTKTGDNGTTKLVDGCCVEKFNPRVEAYGCVDELNSQIGVIRSLINNKNHFLTLNSQLEIIQNQLFSVGSLLATSDKTVFDKLPQINNAHVTQLENWIDLYTADLTALRNFILPAGDLAAAQMHVARTACRRAERRSSEILAKENHYTQVLIYLNRLSDLLFTWARWINLKNDVPDVIWKKEHV